MFSFSAGWHLGTDQAWFSTTPCPLSIHLRWCHFAWVQTTACSPGSSQPSLPLLQSHLHSSLLPKQLPASHCSWLRHSHKPLLPALSCSVLPFLPAPKCIALKSLHRAGGGKRAGCRQGTRLPVLATQALAGTALRASSTRWSQRLNEINKAGSQPLLR